RFRRTVFRGARRPGALGRDGPADERGAPRSPARRSRVPLVDRRVRRGRRGAMLGAMPTGRVGPTKGLPLEDERSFYEWLRKHWDKESEVWVRIYKVKSGIRSITPTQAIDVVLCWGWIDGIRKSFDDESYLQRYTPRGKKSIWSQINIEN